MKKYIEFMVNSTSLIEDDVPVLLNHLFANYRKVTADKVKDLENYV